MKSTHITSSLLLVSLFLFAAPGPARALPPVTTTLPSDCGNGEVEGTEACDDGNTSGNDCCTSECQIPSPTGCFQTEVSTLKVVDDPTDDTKDKLTWAWKKGAEVTMDAFGDPSTTTTYHVCIIDVTPAPTTLEADMTIPPGDYWSGGETKWKLKSEGGSLISGITGGILKPGAAGKSSVKIKGRGEGLPELDLGTEGIVRVQMYNSAGACWFSGPMQIIKAKGKTTKAAGGGPGGA